MASTHSGLHDGNTKPLTATPRHRSLRSSTPHRRRAASALCPCTMSARPGGAHRSPGALSSASRCVGLVTGSCSGLEPWLLLFCGLAAAAARLQRTGKLVVRCYCGRWRPSASASRSTAGPSCPAASLRSCTSPRPRTGAAQLAGSSAATSPRCRRSTAAAGSVCSTAGPPSSLDGQLRGLPPAPAL